MSELRKGFTTGSCAAAAAKAACRMLLSGGTVSMISIITPAGVRFDADILDITRSAESVKCAVRKDGGDDPDVTTGALVYAEVTLIAEEHDTEGANDDNPRATIHTSADRIRIDGGEGVGRVTRPGLDQPPGNAAINSVPRKMIRSEVSEVMDAYDYHGYISVIISVPHGEEIASHTFNPRLGIEGGISVIGTSGIVEPMSRQAILDTIRIELNQKYAEGCRTAFISPGNYGLDFMRETYGIDLDRSVKCSNFIGETIDMIAETGFEGVLLTGHAGKLVKVAGGIMNTHSREADARMEIIAAEALRRDVSRDDLIRILDSLTTDEAFAILDSCGRMKEVASGLVSSIIYYLNRRAGDKLDIECIMYTKDLGQLAASEGAVEMIEVNKEKWNG